MESGDSCSLMDGPKKYNELRKLIPTIMERTLSLQLQQLEEDQVVHRKVYMEKPPLMVEYTLTGFGKTLVPVIARLPDEALKPQRPKKIIRKIS